VSLNNRARAAMLRDSLGGRGVGAGGNMGEVASGVFRKPGHLRLKPLILVD
jgi:hypothetical protein